MHTRANTHTRTSSMKGGATHITARTVNYLPPSQQTIPFPEMSLYIFAFIDVHRQSVC